MLDQCSGSTVTTTIVRNYISGLNDICHTTKGIRDTPGNDVTNGYLTTDCTLPVLSLTVLTLTRGPVVISASHVIGTGRGLSNHVVLFLKDKGMLAKNKITISFVST